MVSRDTKGAARCPGKNPHFTGSVVPDLKDAAFDSVHWQNIRI